MIGYRLRDPGRVVTADGGSLNWLARGRHPAACLDELTAVSSATAIVYPRGSALDLSNVDRLNGSDPISFVRQV